MSHPVYIKCRDDSCRQNAIVLVLTLLKEYGEDITSDEVLRRARCTKCGFQGNNQMRLVYVGKSSLAQTGSAVNKDSHKDVEVYWRDLHIMFTKSNLIRNGLPSLVAFVILYFLGDRYVLPAVFSATDSGNMNLLIWLAIDAAMLLSTFYGTRWALFKFGLIDNWLSK